MHYYFMNSMKRKTHYIDELFAESNTPKTEMIPVISTSDEEFQISSDITVPNEAPILPLRGNILFPHVLLPVTAGRKKSIRLLKRAERNHECIGVFAQKNDVEDPKIDDIFEMGTLAIVVKLIELPEGSHLALLNGIKRITISSITKTSPFLMGNIQEAAPEIDDLHGSTMRTRINYLRKKYNTVQKEHDVFNMLSKELKNITDNKQLVNFMACNNSADMHSKYKLLLLDSYFERLKGLNNLLDGMMEAIDIKAEIERKTRQDMERQQREYYLNQQMHTIQKELGGSPVDKEIDELEKRGNAMVWDAKAQLAFERSIAKLRRTPPSTPDYTVEVNYINTLLDLPWNKYSIDNLSTVNARRVLNRDHYGLEKVKDRIIEQIAVLKLKGDMKSPILCFVGPPGTGKTSLGKSIASALNREYVRIALGGLHDEAEIRGHRRTYVGAMPGRIVQNLIKVQSSNPVFILDEIDKIQTNSFNGDPTSALLEVLDPEQNSAFHDNYLDIDYDLSKVMFIATANSLSTIQPALLDRMEIIDLSGYILEEKLQIASKHLIPKELDAVGFKKNEIEFPKVILTQIINDYTRESGVRQLDKAIAKILRYNAVKVANGETICGKVQKEDLKEILGLPIHQSEQAGKEPRIGVVTGLAWTQVGGEILFIEACTSKGKGCLSMTGNLGDVMKESATLAYEYLKANAPELGIDDKIFEESNIHIHVPEGAVPKDGPSAGITMFVAMYSAFTRKKVKSHLAMTGEITLRGAVTPVGGIKEKILAAKRANITDIMLSVDNRRDIEDIKPSYLNGLTFHYIKEMKEALPIALI